jgi:hypothetical protein
MEAHDDLSAMSDADLRLLTDLLERRRPGAPVPSAGVRPRRRPWTYRDISRLDALRAEAVRRVITPDEPPSP